MQADVTDLNRLADSSFDIVYTGGHIAVWVSNLNQFYFEALRIFLKVGYSLLMSITRLKSVERIEIRIMF